MDAIIQVTTTGDDRNMMEKIGRIIVEQRLASCAQISGPFKSIYWWKGNIEETEEWSCILKSTKAHYEEIQNKIKELHSYDVPEIISVEINRTLPDYEQWVREETANH
ncbi:MAG: Divalent-cation tolerance protein CutA [Syntrophorhabdus sp. PtaU1.Bin153]|nr:MAG: Divalent-cation tolerance protein CutA [Syntrophorhabdus sp. PtaU1.Bin153]